MSATETVTMVKRRLRSAIESSTLGSISATVARSFESSILNRVCTRSIEITKASWLYRWLTAEPEPDVIVIDLRETYTVGPFISVLDAIAPPIARLWQNSGLATLTGALERVLSESTIVRLAAKLLEPPEPPDGRDHRE